MMFSNNRYIRHCIRIEEIELITTSNTAHQSLTVRSPFMQEPLLSDIGYYIDMPQVKQVLNGDYIIPDQLIRYTV